MSASRSIAIAPLIVGCAQFMHQFDGAVIATALPAMAASLHEDPLLLNLATGVASVLGAIVAYFGLRETQHALPYALAFAAAGFLYIAVAGLIPGLHRRADPRTSAIQVTLIAAGIAVIAVAERLAGQ